MRNVLVIVVDRLGYDEISLQPDSAINPTIGQFAKEGVNCRRAFAHGCPTQFAMPAIFTSTLPLDYGGYDRGVADRPVSLYEHLQSNDFHTTGIVAGLHVSAFYGYNRGFDDFYFLADIENIWLHLKYLLRYHIERRDIRQKNGFDFYQDVGKILKRFYAGIIDFCRAKQQEKADPISQHSTIYNYDFKTIEREISLHRDILAQKPAAYIRLYCAEILKTTLRSFLGITNWPAPISDWFFNKAGAFSKGHFNNSFFKFKLWSSFASTTHLVQRFKQQITQKNQKPFAMFMHLLDLHEGFFLNSRLQIAWKRKLFRTNRSLYKNYDKFFQDLSLQYIDSAIKDIKDCLEQQGLLDSTLIVLLGDHGHAPGGPSSPMRLRNGPGGGFHDTYLHIPLIFWHKSLPPVECNSLFSGVDLAPTICDFLNLKTPTSFQGVSLFQQPRKKDFFIAEHTHRGPCDLPNKPVYLCLQSNEYKFIWKEGIYDLDENGNDLMELYDLCKDPTEMDNRVNHPDYQLVVEHFQALAEKRFLEIKPAGSDILATQMNINPRQ